MKNDMYSISVIIPTRNSARTLDACLASIREQNYSTDLIEILVLDGGSTDDTVPIAEKHNCRLIEGHKGDQESRRYIGLHAARNKLICHIDSDNILSHKEWFNNMLKPFIEDERVVATQVNRYGVKEEFGIVNRYFALTGVNDPLALYLSKNEKLPWTEDTWIRGNVLEKKDGYTVVEFTKKTLPTMGTNGFFIKKDALIGIDVKPEEYFHIDIVLDVVENGHKVFAMVDDVIYHDTAASLSSLVARRIKYFVDYNPALSRRRYLLFDTSSRSDVIRLILFVAATVTLLQPMLFSIRGFLKRPDIAWFLHPVVCWMFLIAYGYAYSKLTIKQKLYRQRPTKIFSQ